MYDRYTPLNIYKILFYGLSRCASHGPRGEENNEKMNDGKKTKSKSGTLKSTLILSSSSFYYFSFPISSCLLGSILSSFSFLFFNIFLIYISALNEQGVCCTFPGSNIIPPGSIVGRPDGHSHTNCSFNLFFSATCSFLSSRFFKVASDFHARNQK